MLLPGTVLGLPREQVPPGRHGGTDTVYWDRYQLHLRGRRHQRIRFIR